MGAFKENFTCHALKVEDDVSMRPLELICVSSSHFLHESGKSGPTQAASPTLYKFKNGSKIAVTSYSTRLLENGK